METNPGFSMSVDGQSATPRRFLLDEFRAMRGRDDLGNPVPWALRAARAGEGTGAGTKHGWLVGKMDRNSWHLFFRDKFEPFINIYK